MATTKYDYGIRGALNNKGVDNSRIGYSNGYVTVDGKNFLKAGSVNNGSAMTTQASFNSAFKNLKPTNAPITVPKQPSAASTSPMVQAAASVQKSPQATYTPPTKPTEQTLQRMSDLIGQPAFQYKAPEAWSYDPQSDPSYTSSLAEAKRNIEREQADTNARLRANGQGKSSYSELVANQVADDTMESLANTLVPQLMQQSYARYQDSANRDLQLQQLNYGVQRDQMSDLSNLYGLQNQEYFQNPIAEAQLTGNYLPAEGKQIVNELLSLKQQAETKGISADQRTALSQQADTLRAQLSALGIDPSRYGSNVSYSAASQTAPGIRTLQGQQLDLQNKQANMDAATTVSDATGRLVTPQSDWNGLYRQAANAPLTWNATQDVIKNQQFDRQQTFNEGQQQWENAYNQAQFAEDVRQFGLSYAIEQDNLARQWASLDYEMATGGGNGYSGMTASQALSSARQMFRNKDGKIPTNAATKQKIYEYVGSLGLPTGQDDQVMLSLGLNPDEIAKFDKEYEVPMGN
ncbi:hypothetical protein [Paenibacillus medicaginis]|uniref:Peptidase S74 domain-containing protein n=1 Tax=Paenibacillus medicaginis TaxID=1470560 RepID=A0ABV5C0S6_9BACL